MSAAPNICVKISDVNQPATNVELEQNAEFQIIVLFANAQRYKMQYSRSIDQFFDALFFSPNLQLFKPVVKEKLDETLPIF